MERVAESLSGSIALAAILGVRRGVGVLIGDSGSDRCGLGTAFAFIGGIYVLVAGFVLQYDEPPLSVRDPASIKSLNLWVNRDQATFGFAGQV